MKTRIWFALIALYIVWGSTYLGIRYAVETIPPFLSAATRFFVSGMMLYVWRRAAGDPRPSPRQWGAAAITGTLLLLGGNGLVSWAEQRVASGIAALLIGTVPLWLVVIEALRSCGTKPGWKTMLGLAFGFVGIAVLVVRTNSSNAPHEIDLLGFLALLMASLLWSIGSIYSRTADLPRSTLMNTGTQMLVGSMALLSISLINGELNHLQMSEISSRSLWGLGYLIFVGSLIGFVSYGWLLQNAPVSLVSTYAYVNPLVAVLLGNWLGQEPLTAQLLISAVVIIGSVILINADRFTTRAQNPKSLSVNPMSLSDHHSKEA